jgi:hypothetical protein
MKIFINGNSKASDTIKLLKEVGTREYRINLVDNPTESDVTLNYGISNFLLSKSEQAVLFEDIISNTIIKQENYNIIDDYKIVVMKNPTRVLLWKDAKKEIGTKYLYVNNKMEWRINYAYGKIISILNKNIGTNIFGKSSLSQWSIERSDIINNELSRITYAIAERVEGMSNLKSFGLDIIYDRDCQEFLFLELNQANSMNENTCRLFLKAYLDTIQKDITDIGYELTLEQLEKIITKFINKGVKNG